MAPGSLFNVFTELNHKAAVDAANLLSRTTGGRTFNFLKQSGLEDAIHAVADEVHRQYIISFQPKLDTRPVPHDPRGSKRQAGTAGPHARRLLANSLKLFP
jgi:hypothetical protein